ncbi:colorectal mutant cancer protein isoform X2 [Osmerus eperlanus]|uniref:colorectal mutant cancer protein isoform X2 n=1 Tax=Osmerus eperlanus TaxID=29151 RepID=UPI002E14B748
MEGSNKQEAESGRAEMEPCEAEPSQAELAQCEAEVEPSQAELAQCEAEVGTLLSVIAELNRKMGALEAPRDSEDSKPVEAAVPLAPVHPARPSSRCAPARREGGSEVWCELQEVLSALEESVSSRKSWATPNTAFDRDKQTEHLAAARESWALVTQVLEDMEREFGISYPSELPTEDLQGYRREVLALHQSNRDLRSTLQHRQEALEAARFSVAEMEEEKNKLQEWLQGIHKTWWSTGSISPPCSPSDSSSGGALSPGWVSPPFPGSPLFPRRPSRAFSALSTGGDSSPSASPRLARASLGSPSPSPCPSPCPSPVTTLEGERERMQRCIERLKARNERLSGALERRKGESEQISMTLSRHEADHTALQMAVRYCEECEEVYGDLLSLYQAKKQQCIPHWRDTAVVDRELPGSPRAQLRSLRTEELSTSFSTPGGAVERQTHKQASLRSPGLQGREVSLREQIRQLKQDRAALCVPKPGPGGEGQLSPDTGTLAGTRAKGPKPGEPTPDASREKATLLYELVTVREEMSELRGLIRLREKERRCLDWSLMAQKAQDAAGELVAESLQEELEDRRADRQRLSEAKLAGEDEPGPGNSIMLRELLTVLHREQLLKRRVSAMRGSLDSALSDSATHRRDSEEQKARLAQAHSKATGTYRNARRKYREQLWRLERQVTAMSERHMTQIGALKATLEALEWRREETVL